MAKILRPKWILCYCEKVVKSGGSKCTCDSGRTGKRILNTDQIVLVEM